MMFKSIVWYLNRDQKLTSYGDLLDAPYEAMNPLDAAHKALHRATDYVRTSSVSVEVTVCTPNRGYPVGARDPFIYGGTKSYPAMSLLGAAA